MGWQLPLFDLCLPGEPHRVGVDVPAHRVNGDLDGGSLTYPLDGSRVSDVRERVGPAGVVGGVQVVGLDT